MKNRIIIFGSEYIEGFCNNNGLLAGTEKYGKQIIPFEKLKNTDCIVMIAVTGSAAYEIAEQCEENEIQDYLIEGRNKAEVNKLLPLLQLDSQSKVLIFPANMSLREAIR